MTIGNDSFTIGTAAAAAGVTNVGYQNREAIRSNVARIFKKDTVEIAKEGTKKAKDTVKASTKKSGKLGAMASAAGESIKKGFETAKNTVVDSSKALWDKSGKLVKGTNWKTAGKYAGVAAGVAAALVLAKNFFFPSNDDVEEV